MKRLLIVIFCFVLCSAANSQIIKDANYSVDYSQVMICGMDEETFAEVEEDWFKDRPEISGNILQELLNKTAKYLSFKKSSQNQVIVYVKNISDNGKFNADIALFNEKNELFFKIQNVSCSKGGTWGTKLHLMKEGALKEGKNLGNAFINEFKKYR